MQRRRPQRQRLSTSTVSSLQNPRVQAARRLHRRAWRERTGTFLLEGPVVVREALASDVAISDVFLSADDPDLSELRAQCEEEGAKVFEVGDNVLKALADAATPQGVVAVASTPVFELEALPAGSDLVLVLAQVRDPGNAGTLVRSAAAAGAACVVFTEGSVDAYGPKTVRGSAGAVFKIPIARSISLEDAFAALRDKGLSIIAAEGGAEDEVYDLDLTPPAAIVVGNEAWGLDGAAEPDLFARVPMKSAIESLNVATAGSLFLFEAARQRRLSSARHG